METGTVLTIIAILDQRIAKYDEMPSMDDDHFGGMRALEDLRDHLQNFIEAQVTAIEMQTGE